MLKTYKLQNLLLGVAIAIVTHSSASAIPLEEHLASVVNHLVGEMDTSIQASVNPQVSSVKMTTCLVKIPDGDTNAVYLYQEQALNQKLHQPYRQRFLKITASEDQASINSESYRPPNFEQWIGLCSQPESQRTIQLKDLGTFVCTVNLKPLLTIYVGNTQAGGCPANFRGAVKITNTIILHPTGMDTWDRGFDAQGNQLWGARDEAYQFRKL